MSRRSFRDRVYRAQPIKKSLYYCSRCHGTNKQMVKIYCARDLHLSRRICADCIDDYVDLRFRLLEIDDTEYWDALHRGIF